MSPTDLLVEAGVDVLVLALAVAAGFLLAERVRGTGLSIPLTVLFASAAGFVGCDAASRLAEAAGDLVAAEQFARASYIGVGFSVPALVHVASVFPRRLHSPGLAQAMSLTYAAGALFAVLSPTNLIFRGMGIADGSGEPTFGPAYLPLQGILVSTLVAALAWAVYLALRGKTEEERRGGAGFAAILTAPIAAAATSVALGSRSLGDIDLISVGYGAAILLMYTVLSTGRLARPIPSSLHGLLDSVTDATLIVGSDGLISTANRSSARLLGRPEGELAHTPLRGTLEAVLRRPEDATFVQNTAMGVLRGRLDAHESVLEGVGPSLRTCRLRILPLGERTSRGEATAALIMLTDETERRSRELATSSSREVLDLVIRMLGHDLKAPLTVLQGYIDLDKARLEGGDDAKAVAAVRADLNKMSEALVGMQVLMGNARALSRLAAVGEELALLEVDLSRFVKQALDMVKPVATARQITLEGEVAEGVRVVVVPGFDSVPRNLIDNAIKYTPPGGRVTVRLSAEQGRVALTVADTGPGIPPEKLDLLFRKFERLGAEKGPQEGHGLGLSIVAKLVELSSGTLAAEDRQDGKPGAVFRVELLQSGGRK